VSIASPPRPTAPRTAPRQLVEERPLRYPDAGSREVMTRRGWWLVILNFLIPGSAQAAAGNRRLARFGLGATMLMWALVVLGLAAALLWPTGAFGFVTGAWIPNWLALLRALPLLLIQGLFIAYAILWVVLAIDTLRLVRLVKTGTIARFGIATAAIALTVLAAGTAAYG
jgi:hypothetical protein